jgi:hypothetical protein
MSDNVVLRRGYFILFCFILSLYVYFKYAANAVRNSSVHQPDEQTGKPDDLSFTEQQPTSWNCTELLLGE